MNSLTIVRSEVEELEGIRGWIILYGRRKVGKTFLLRNFVRWDAYVTVRRDLSIRSEGVEVNSADELVDAAGTVLERGGTLIIDEFQRLPLRMLEDLTAFHPSGRLILSGSSLGVARKVFEPRSPLLGFFTPFKLSLVRPADALKALSRTYEPARAVELASYLRDPWLVPLCTGEVEDLVYRYACRYWQIVRSLIGEVFAEEERTLTITYEAILLLLGARRWRLHEIASVLYARGLLREPSSSHVAGFVRNLVEMDLVRPIKLYGSRRKIYRIKSPIMEAYYYLESKYEVSEREVEYDEVAPAIQALVRQHVEDFVADLAAQHYRGRREYSLSPEIDFVITRRGRPVAVGKVKWGRYTHRDLEAFREKVSKLPGLRLFIARSKEEDVYKDVYVLDAEDLASLRLPEG